MIRRPKKLRFGCSMQRRLRLEELTKRELMAGDISPWHNPDQPADVNRNQQVTAIDALLVINQISLLPLDRPELSNQTVVPTHLKVDTNNDGLLTSVDVLLVINRIASPTLLAAPSITSIERLPSATGVFQFLVRGTATAGAMVELRQNGVDRVDQSVTGSDGNWEIVVNEARLSDSKFSYTATELDFNGVPIGESAAKSYQPNIVLVNVNDMRYEQTRFMPYLQSLESEATTFSNAYVPTSVSGPSRASLLTGNFAIRHGVLNNSLTLGTSLNEDHSSTLPVWMSEAGYRTGLFGKDRTGPGIEAAFKTQEILESRPGWDDYFSTIKKGNLGYNVSFTDNGTLFEAGPDSYATDVMRDQAMDFIRQTPRETPFFAYIATNAPHVPGIPADRHSTLFDDIEVPKGPAYAPTQEQLDIPGFIELQERHYRNGSESLVAIDEALEAIVSELAQLDELDNTVLIFVSDHGQGVGEHGMFSKNRFWEESMQVPLIVWDGRAPVGQESSSLVTMAEITGTLVDLGDAEPLDAIDGRSMLPILSDPATDVRDDFLIQHIYDDDLTNLQREYGVHTGSMVYVESDFPIQGNTRFLFDLDLDPFQRNNLIGDPVYQTEQATMTARLQELRGSDRQAPELQNVFWSVAGTDYDQPQTLRLNAQVSDDHQGSNEIRTPSLTFDRFALFTDGIPLEPTDGTFDHSFESTFTEIDFGSLAEAPDQRLAYLSTRDVVGNLSDKHRLVIPVGSAPKLVRASDTGASDGDGITLDSTPTFSGQANPGERVALFTPGGPSEKAVLLGTTTVDSSGKWSVSTSLPAAGEYVVYGQVGPSLSAPVQSVHFLAPTKIHLLAYQDGSRIRVRGTDLGDEIIVTELPTSEWDFQINGIDVGSLSAATQLIVDGRNGDDYIRVDGNIRSRLIGNAGDDHLVGGHATDVLIGGIGNNYLEGRLGNDIYQVSFTDTQLGVETRGTVIRDTIDESIGEGLDRIRFIGEFDIIAELNENQNPPHFVLQPRYDYQRIVHVREIAAIERIDGNHRDAEWNSPLEIDIYGGSGDDRITATTTIEAETNVNLANLQIGGDANETVNSTLQVNAGSIFIASDLPPTVQVISQTTTAIELQGTRTAINLALLQSRIRVQADSGFHGDLIVHHVSNPLSDATPIQSDQLIASIAKTIDLTGVPNHSLLETGTNLRMFPTTEITDPSLGFSGGSVRLQFFSEVYEDDLLILIPQVPGPVSITRQGASVLYGGIGIGQLQHWQSNSEPLVVELNEQANSIAVRSLLRRLAFRNLSSEPVRQTRRISLTLLGENGANATEVVDVDLQRDPVVLTDPTLSFVSGNVLEYDSSTNRYIALATGNRVTSSSESFAGGTLTIQLTNSSSTSESLRLLSGTFPNRGFIELNATTGEIIFNDKYAGNFQFASSHAIAFSFTRNSDIEMIQALLRRVQYRNRDATPATADQIVRFELTDTHGLSTGPIERTIQFQ